MATQPQTIDCQVHCYAANTPERPWRNHLEGPDEVTGDDMVAAMNAVGVDGAILISALLPVRLRPQLHPRRLRTASRQVRPRPALRPQFRVHRPRTLTSGPPPPGVVGCRIMLANQDYEADHPGLNAIFAACARVGVPVNVMAAGKLPLLTELARRNPDTSVIIDHVGLAQPFRAAAARRTLRRPAQRAGRRRAGQRGHQDFRRLHSLPPVLPLPRHLGAPGPYLRRLRPRPLPLGHRLDPRREAANLRAGRRVLPRDRPPHRL